MILLLRSVGLGEPVSVSSVQFCACISGVGKINDWAWASSRLCRECVHITHEHCETENYAIMIGPRAPQGCHMPRNLGIDPAENGQFQ